MHCRPSRAIQSEAGRQRATNRLGSVYTIAAATLPHRSRRCYVWRKQARHGCISIQPDANTLLQALRRVRILNMLYDHTCERYGANIPT